MCGLVVLLLLSLSAAQAEDEPKQDPEGNTKGSDFLSGTLDSLRNLHAGVNDKATWLMNAGSDFWEETKANPAVRDWQEKFSELASLAADRAKGELPAMKEKGKKAAESIREQWNEAWKKADDLKIFEKFAAVKSKENYEASVVLFLFLSFLILG